MSYSLPINNSFAVSRSESLASLASTDSDRAAYSGLLNYISNNPNFFDSSLLPSRSNSGVSRSNSGVSRSASTDSDRVAYARLLDCIASDSKFFSSVTPSRNNSRDLSQSNSHMMSTRSVSDMSLGVIWYGSTESIPVFQSNTIVQNNNNTKSAKKTSNQKIVGKASRVSKKGTKNPKLSEYSKTRLRIRGRFVRNTEYDTKE